MPKTSTQDTLLAVLERADYWGIPSLFETVENQLILTITPATYKTGKLSFNIPVSNN